MGLCWQNNVSAFNMLSRLVIAFLPRSKCFLISWLQSPSAVILEPKKIKSVTISIVPPSICHEVMGLDAMIFVFWMLSFKPAFSLSSFTFIKRLFSSSLFPPIRVMSSAIWGYWYFPRQSWFQLARLPAQRFSWCTLHISRVTIFSLDTFLSRFGTCPLIHGEGNGNPLQYSYLENPSDRGVWWAAIYGVTQSRTWLRDLAAAVAAIVPCLVLTVAYWPHFLDSFIAMWAVSCLLGHFGPGCRALLKVLLA